MTGLGTQVGAEVGVDVTTQEQAELALEGLLAQKEP